jgi:hypothetical protein
MTTRPDTSASLYAKYAASAAENYEHTAGHGGRRPGRGRPGGARA